MDTAIEVVAVDPTDASARQMSEALWDEVQARYGFSAPNRFDPGDFDGPVARFWVAVDAGRPIGSIALADLDGAAAELDVMYVAPGHRGRGVADSLLAALEEHARAVGISLLRLRAGEPQPEALRFYRRAGFVPAPPFGRWVEDPTALCFEKWLDQPV